MQYKFNFVLRTIVLRVILWLYSMLVGFAEKDHIVGYDAGAGLLVALLISDFSIRNLALNHGALTFLQILQDCIPQIGLKDDHTVPVGTLSPVTVFISTKKYINNFYDRLETIIVA